jgi:hypothetical protein
MVNVRMLNGELACVSQPDFREIFRVLGHFPRFKNPVKYTRGSRINQFSPLPVRIGAVILPYISAACAR